MQELASLAGGWLQIDSARGRGTTVEFWIPGLAVPGVTLLRWTRKLLPISRQRERKNADPRSCGRLGEALRGARARLGGLDLAVLRRR
jgi:hypothetical protein